MRENPTYQELLEYIASLEAKVRDLEVRLAENQVRSEKLKTRFLANVSHELRTPMNAILGFSNLIIDKNLTHDKREEYMEHISMNGNSLLNLVDSMIDVSLLQIRELRIKKEKCNLNELMQQMYHLFNIDRHKQGKDHIAMLFNNFGNRKDTIIYTDPFRLSQVLSSLLHNALKFTQKGIIEFGYFFREDQALQFFVKDSGRGILADKAMSIFDKFEKLDEERLGADGGLGLGLTLAKGIIELLGGEIWVENNIFKGSTFNFTIEYKLVGEEDFATKKSLHSILV